MSHVGHRMPHILDYVINHTCICNYIEVTIKAAIFSLVLKKNAGAPLLEYSSPQDVGTQMCIFIVRTHPANELRKICTANPVCMEWMCIAIVMRVCTFMCDSHSNNNLQDACCLIL